CTLRAVRKRFVNKVIAALLLFQLAFGLQWQVAHAIVVSRKCKQVASKRSTVLTIPPRTRRLTREAALQHRRARRPRTMALHQNTIAAAPSVACVIVPKAQGCLICLWRALFFPPPVYCHSS